MVGPEVRSHGLGVRPLVELRVAEADGKRLDQVDAGACHQGGNSTRVHATAEEDAKRDVAYEVGRHSFLKPRFQLRDDGALARHRLGPCCLERPVPVQRCPGRGTDEVVRRRKLPDSPKDRPRSGHVEVRQEVIDALRRHPAVDPWAEQQRFHLRRERQSLGRVAVVQGLDTEPISTEEQRALPGVPEREREHPAQVLEEPHALLLVQVRDHFGIPGTAQFVPTRDQVATEVAVIVDLAVEHHLDAAILVREWLVAGLEIDHLEPPDAEAHGALDVVAVGIRTPVNEQSGHASHHRHGRGLVRHVVVDARYAAHRLFRGGRAGSRPTPS